MDKCNQSGEHEFYEELISCIGRSPSPYHASAYLARKLRAAGYQCLVETEDWNLKPGGRYYVVRSDTSLIAWRNVSDRSLSNGLRIVGTHLDSPCLRIKPEMEFSAHGYRQLSVEVYGSPLLRTWFDRELSIAGRVFFENQQAAIDRRLVDLQKPVAFIPSIAIHLDRAANTKQSINSQIHINPLSGAGETAEAGHFYQLITEALQIDSPELEMRPVSGFDLCLYDINPPRIIGGESNFLASARIDNLVSCFAGLQALLAADTQYACLLVCNDHEEVGSLSDSGAQGGFLNDVLRRLDAADPRVVRKSAMISADGAHGVHPNYPEKHDTLHAPVLNGGVAIKINANQRYATTGELAAVIKTVAVQLEVPIQEFVSRNNMPCGTTIGPIVASETGIRTLDLGVPQLAMHSIREIAGLRDIWNLQRLLAGFFAASQVTVVD